MIRVESIHEIPPRRKKKRGLFVDVCVLWEQETEGVMPVVFFNVRINHEPSPEESTRASAPLFQQVEERETLEG